MGGLLESPFMIALIVFIIGVLVALYIVYFFDRIFIKKQRHTHSKVLKRLEG